ncbi:MAG: glycosyltransferase family 2 protein [Patescibacteria group bacterium]
MKLSVVLATRNEEKNIGECLASVKDIADEIIVADEYSTDKTREIAEKFGAKVFEVPHHDIFHVTKQKALTKAQGEWILQLDADERVTPELAKEIKKVINMDKEELLAYQEKKHPKSKLFAKHQRLVEERDGKIGKATGEVVAFFIPRLNFFLGKPLRHAGVYPDGVIRLVKNGKARFPRISVHEQIEVDGEVGWLINDLEHHDSPTFERYLSRLNRYTDLKAKELAKDNVSKDPLTLLYYSSLKPLFIFLNLYVRHAGFKDGMRGFVWSLFSSLHFPISYFKYFAKGK